MIPIYECFYYTTVNMRDTMRHGQFTRVFSKKINNLL